MKNHKDIAKRVLKTEAAALAKMADTLSDEFDAVVNSLKAIEGRIVLTGVGKSGHVARKIAATLASTGTPSYYVHPTEASHGDMGMITRHDAVIALSRSGETNELADIIGFCRRFSVSLIGLTAIRESSLGRAANHVLLIPDAPEACAETRAPTTSTTLQMALGDALAVALLEAKGFTASEFKTYHPGGALGASLSTVSDLMHTGDRIPLVQTETDLQTSLLEMNEKGFGCVGVISEEKLIGIFTDGDIRRNIDKGLSNTAIDDVMTRNPKSASGTTLAADALRDMTTGPQKIMQLFVTENDIPIGIVHLHDFLRAGIM